MEFASWVAGLEERVRREVAGVNVEAIDDETVTLRAGRKGVVVHRFAGDRVALQGSMRSPTQVNGGAREQRVRHTAPQTFDLDEASIAAAGASIVAALREDANESR